MSFVTKKLNVSRRDVVEFFGVELPSGEFFGVSTSQDCCEICSVQVVHGNHVWKFGEKAPSMHFFNLLQYQSGSFRWSPSREKSHSRKKTDFYLDKEEHWASTQCMFAYKIPEDVSSILPCVLTEKISKRLTETIFIEVCNAHNGNYPREVVLYTKKGNEWVTDVQQV